MISVISIHWISDAWEIKLSAFFFRHVMPQDQELLMGVLDLVPAVYRSRWQIYFNYFSIKGSEYTCSEKEMWTGKNLVESKHITTLFVSLFLLYNKMANCFSIFILSLQICTSENSGDTQNPCLHCCSSNYCNQAGCGDQGN